MERSSTRRSSEFSAFTLSSMSGSRIPLPVFRPELLQKKAVFRLAVRGVVGGDAINSAISRVHKAATSSALRRGGFTSGRSFDPLREKQMVRRDFAGDTLILVAFL